MVKDYDPSTNTTISTTLNCDEQKVVVKKETQEILSNIKNSGTIKSTDQNWRQRSQKFIDKFRNMRFYSSKSSNQEELKPSDVYNNQSEERENNRFDLSNKFLTPSMNCQSKLASAIDLESRPREEVKLKGILKNSTKDSSCSDSSNSHNPFQSSESSFVTNSKGNSDDLLSSDSNYNSQSSTSNSSKLIKHVKFNDEVSKAKYKPNRDVFNVTKLASRQQKKLKKLHRKDPLNLHSIYTTDVDFNERNYIGLRQARRFHSWDSSGTESSDDD